MTISTTVLFDSPRREIASLLNCKLEQSVSTQIVAGFATIDGMKAIENSLRINPKALHAFVIGAGTYRAFDAFDRLRDLGVSPDVLRVHLGHTNSSGGKSNPFHRYHPMLHSKIYYIEHAGGIASALIGSHNLTKFALCGLNGEAAVLLEGDKTSPQFEKVRQHIARVKDEAVVYAPEMRAALAWWTRQSIDGLAVEVNNEIPRNGDNVKTIVILCEHQGSPPRLDDSFYFELDEDLGSLNSLATNIHLYVFDELPTTSRAALAAVDSAKASYKCGLVGLDVAQGGKEYEVDWYLECEKLPILKRVKVTHRPAPKPNMQQLRVRIDQTLEGHYDYRFDPDGQKWKPRLDETQKVEISSPEPMNEKRRRPASTKVESWFLVKELDSFGDSENKPRRPDKLSIAMRKMSPDQGSYLVISLRHTCRPKN